MHFFADEEQRYFGSVLTTFQSLFIVMTLDGWADIAHQAQLSRSFAPVGLGRWQRLANVGRLVLGCIDVSDSDSRRIFKSIFRNL